MRKKRIIKRLAEIAKRSPVRIQVAAGGIGANGRFIWGINSYADLPIPSLRKPDQWTLHAEMHALLKIIRAGTFVDTLVVVAPKNTKKGFRPSRPCPRCMAVLRNSGRIGKVKYFNGKEWVVENLTSGG